jgi:hypothetical protein
MAIPDNKRIFYACQAVVIEPFGTQSAESEVMHGLQSVGVTTNFNLEQAFELGMIQIYENIEGLPEVEVTMEKVLDGYPLIYTSATRDAGSAATASTRSLVNRSAERCNIYLGIYDSTQDVVGDGTGIQASVKVGGAYVNSISYTIPVDGNCTESVTFVANDKLWSTSNQHGKLANATVQAAFDSDTSSNAGDDVPKNSQLGSYKGGVQRRENVDLSSPDGSAIPRSVMKASDDAHSASHSQAQGNNASKIAHIQNITISTDFGREDILELGSKVPYFRAANFPIEVTCEIECIATEGDWVNAYEAGDPALTGADVGNNTTNETIIIVLEDGTKFDLGTKNRLSSVSYGGGDAGGGNATMTFSYTTFNQLDITPPNGSDN